MPVPCSSPQNVCVSRGAHPGPYGIRSSSPRRGCPARPSRSASAIRVAIPGSVRRTASSLPSGSTRNAGNSSGCTSSARQSIPAPWAGRSRCGRPDRRPPTPGSAGRDAAVVGVVDRPQRRRLLVPRGARPLGDSRVPAVGADHDAGADRAPRAVGRPQLDPGRAPVFPDEPVRARPLQQLDAVAADRLPDERHVQPVAAGAERVGARRSQRPLNDDIAEVGAQAAEPPQVGRLHLGEDAEPVQHLHCGRLEQVGGERIAGEIVAVHQQDTPALAAEQDGEARPRHPSPTTTASYSMGLTFRSARDRPPPRTPSRRRATEGAEGEGRSGARLGVGDRRPTPP